jgi:hypothetical protein
MENKIRFTWIDVGNNKDVYFCGSRVGTIKRVKEGWQFFNLNSNVGGIIFDTISQCEDMCEEQLCTEKMTTKKFILYLFGACVFVILFYWYYTIARIEESDLLIGKQKEIEELNLELESLRALIIK